MKIKIKNRLYYVVNSEGRRVSPKFTSLSSAMDWKRNNTPRKHSDTKH